ncbi:STAS/SEC14 domain-containing protein [bacterium]|nr:STAS/SEC14 domain-containing protein [bacterium]
MDDGPELLAISARGKLEVEDYEQLVPAMERLIDKQGAVDLLVQLEDFAGWSAGAAWEDTKVGIRHFNDVRRMAIVGDSLWQKGMALFVKPFTAATVRYFDVAETPAAISWLRG